MQHTLTHVATERLKRRDHDSVSLGHLGFEVISNLSLNISTH